MDKIARDFVSQESRDFKFQVGRLIASALAGFVAGVVGASIIWITVIEYYKVLS